MISADLLFYILQGRNFEGMGDLMKAERFYIKGFNVMPNRIYPLYMLMELYEKSNQHKKSMYMASKTISIKVKIESQATRIIQRKAVELYFK